MVSISSTSNINSVQLPKSPVQTPASNSSAQPLPVAFPADSVPLVARGMPSKVCIGKLSFRVGAMKTALGSARESVQAALKNIVPNQTPELDENRMFSYLAYSDPQKKSGQMRVIGEVDNQNNLLSLTAMHVHPDTLPAAIERPAFEAVRFKPPLHHENSRSSLAASPSIGSLPQSSIRSGRNSLERLDLPLSDVVASSELLIPKNGNNDYTMFDGGQVKAKHEPKYKLIRTYVGRSNEEVVNINLSDDGKMVRSITGYPQLSPEKLQRLVTAGLLSPGLSPIVGVSQEQTKIATGRAAHDQQLTLRLQTHSVYKLPPIENYSGTDHNTKLVAQGEAHFLSSAKTDVGGLYTTGANTGVILIAVVKNAQGKPERVAMTHMDGFVKDQAVNQFFGSLPASGKVEVTLLAGDEEAAKCAMKAADEAGADVVFAHAGHTPEEGYGAAVDRDGSIYFGKRPSLSKQIDTAKVASRIDKAIMNGGVLPIPEQLLAQFHI